MISLGEIGNSSKSVISSLIKGLKDTETDVRSEAANSLNKIGSNASDSIPYLIEAIKDQSWVVRKAAVKALSGIGKVTTSSIPTLLNSLEDEDWRVRQAVVNTISQLGAEVIPGLLNLLNLVGIAQEGINTNSLNNLVDTQQSIDNQQLQQIFQQLNNNNSQNNLINNLSNMLKKNNQSSSGLDSLLGMLGGNGNLDPTLMLKLMNLVNQIKESKGKQEEKSLEANKPVKSEPYDREEDNN